MEKKKFTKPELKIVNMGVESVIAASTDRISANTATIIVNDLTNSDGTQNW